MPCTLFVIMSIRGTRLGSTERVPFFFPRAAVAMAEAIAEAFAKDKYLYSMKHSFYLFALILLIPFMALSVAEVGGHPFTSADSKISIKMPAEFEKEVSELDDGKTTKVSCTLDGILYFFSWTEHITPMTDHTALATTSLNAFNETVGATITEQKPYFYKNHEGVSATMVAEGKGYFNYRVILIGQFQFQLVVASTADNIRKSSKKFFKSFKYKG